MRRFRAGRAANLRYLCWTQSLHFWVFPDRRMLTGHTVLRREAHVTIHLHISENTKTDGSNFVYKIRQLDSVVQILLCFSQLDYTAFLDGCRTRDGTQWSQERLL